jgi:hypothetical protein
MLQHVDISAFRTRYKNKKPVYRNNPAADEHFIGSQHGDTSGFFLLFHGDKEVVENFLRSNFQMAEDAQAVYEFIQNAADCHSTRFWLYFDDHYFLAINNGNAFTEESIQSILNIGQSHGKSTGESIGRYGVGFKLVHRLVGRTDGLDEIVKENKGPILFSWSRGEDFKSFLNTDLSYSESGLDTPDAPWLLKILLTCFPVQPEEVVRGIDYQPITPFKQQELDECRAFTAKHLAGSSLADFSQGSLFFLRLGEGKADTLKRESHDLSNGAGVSFRFLKNLRQITLNGEDIQHSNLRWLPQAIIQPGTPEFEELEITDSKTKSWPVNIEVGFMPFRKSGDIMRRAPNFYKFFPMGDEVNGLNFVVHSNAFDHETNRRKLHDQSTNHRLLEATSWHILDTAEKADDELFQEIFANVLLSAPPDAAGKEWQRPYLYDTLIKFFKFICPAVDENGKFVRAKYSNVIIKDTNLPIHPADWGINLTWFYWYKSDLEASELIRQVEFKFDIKRWNLADLLQHGEPAKIKAWLLAQWEEDATGDLRSQFFKEVDKISQSDWVKNNGIIFGRVLDLPLFLFENGGNHSLLEIVASPSLLVLQADTTQNIASILTALGFTVSTMVLRQESEFAKRAAIFIGLSEPKKHFDKVVAKLNERISGRDFNLSLNERYDLFLCLRKINNDPKVLRDLIIFTNAKGEYRPLRNILPPHVSEVHLSEYKLDVKNAFAIQQTISPYLCKEEEIFQNIIIPYWTSVALAQPQEQITSFLQKTIDYYNLDNNKHHTLNNKSIVFLNDIHDLYQPGTVFFHQKIAELTPEKFRLVDSAASAVLGRSLSRPEWVELLIKPPFSVKDTAIHAFSVDMRAATLDFGETRAYIEFLQSCGEDLFEHFFVIEENGLVKIEPRGGDGKAQYCTDDGQIVQVFSELLPRFKRLPSVFKDLSYDSKKIRSSGALECFMVRILADEEDWGQNMARLIPLLKTTDAATLLFQKTAKFILVELEVYDEGDQDIQWLNLALKFFKEKELVEWRKKIWIQPITGLEYSLEQCPASDNFLLDNHRLQLSQLFPDDQHQINNATSQRIFSRLKKAKFLEQGLESLFGKEEEELEESLIEEYVQRLPENLENGTQVAFFALVNARGTLTFSDKKIQCLNSEWQVFKSQWSITKRPFIDHGYLFADKYEGLAKILKIKKENPVFRTETGFSLIYDFYFEEEKFVWFGWKSKPTEEERLSAFIYLYELWMVSPPHQFSCLPIESFIKTLGFQPTLSIWPSQFAVEAEILPDNVAQWLESKPDHTSFLDKIGVQTLESPVVKLRRFLTQEDVDFLEHDLTRGFDVDQAEHILLLTNTLLFLTGKVFKEERHLNMLKAIFELLPVSDTENNIPALCVHSVSATSGFSYHLLQEFRALVGFDETTLGRLQKVGISNSKFLDFFQERKLFLFNKDLYPSYSHALPDFQAEVSDPLPDWETIQAGSIEWDAPYYLAWKTETRPSIYMYDGFLPELVFCYPIESEPIIKLNQADFLFGENQIYLDKSKDVINALIAATNSDVINSKDLGDFYTLKTKPAAIEGYSGDPNFPGASGDFDPRNQMPYWGSFELEGKIEVNDEAKRSAAEWLRQRGYQVPDPLETNYYRLRNVRNKEGQIIKVHVRSAQRGNLFLSPTDWSELGESGALLLVVLPGGKISSITFDDLMRSNGRINLQFDAQTFNPEGLMLFAKIFHYVPGVKFVIQAPNFSASDYIKEFGLYKRVQESIKSAPTNLID